MVETEATGQSRTTMTGRIPECDVDGIEWESVSCNLCGGDDTRPLHRLRERAYGLPGLFQVVECEQCHLVYLNPRPTRRSIRMFYPPSYAPYIQSQTEIPPGRWGRMKSWIKRRIFETAGAMSPECVGQQRLKRSIWLTPLVWFYTLLNPRFIPFEEGKRVLDIGCGRGDLLRFLRDLGWEVHGLEPDPETARACRDRFGLDVIETEFEEYGAAPEPFDLVVFNHVLEHLHHPSEALRRANRLLRPGGRLLICAPDITSIEYRMFKDDWFSLECPRHLSHFSPTTLGQMLRQTGFTEPSVRYEPAEFTLRHSLEYRFHDRLILDRSSLALILLKGGCFLVSLMFAIAHRGSIITIIARKTGRG